MSIPPSQDIPVSSEPASTPSPGPVSSSEIPYQKNVPTPTPNKAEDAVYIDDPGIAGLLSQVASRMGGVSESDALRRSLRTMLALYDAKAQGGKPLVRYERDRTEQAVNLPGAS